MKVRRDFVTNSSSSSFVICKDNLPDDKKTEIIKYIERAFTNISREELMEDCQNCDVQDIYYLIDYNENDNEMHTWVKRDESMCDDFIDDILYRYDLSSYSGKNPVSPKFDYHY